MSEKFESQHPREPKGTPEGGDFTKKPVTAKVSVGHNNRTPSGSYNLMTKDEFDRIMNSAVDTPYVPDTRTDQRKAIDAAKKQGLKPGTNAFEQYAGKVLKELDRRAY